jgi:YgiT-type zinc finger domain-containing protein
MPSLCRKCKSKLTDGTTTVTLWRDGVSIEIQNVPAQVCPACSEAYVHIDVAEELDRVADAMVERCPRLEGIIGETMQKVQHPLRGLTVAWS